MAKPQYRCEKLQANKIDKNITEMLSGKFFSSQNATAIMSIVDEPLEAIS